VPFQATVKSLPVERSVDGGKSVHLGVTYEPSLDDLGRRG